MSLVVKLEHSSPSTEDVIVVSPQCGGQASRSINRSSRRTERGSKRTFHASAPLRVLPRRNQAPRRTCFHQPMQGSCPFNQSGTGMRSTRPGTSMSSALPGTSKASTLPGTRYPSAPCAPMDLSSFLDLPVFEMDWPSYSYLTDMQSYLPRSRSSTSRPGFPKTEDIRELLNESSFKNATFSINEAKEIIFNSDGTVKFKHSAERVEYAPGGN